MTPRPATLAQIAERSESVEDFGRHLRDWLHELRRVSSRLQVEAAVAERPRRLQNRFAGGAAGDAWLAAYAEFLAQRTGFSPPRWAYAPDRVAPEPWFANESGSLASRIFALRQTPLPFKRRNLYTPSVEMPVMLRAGRPAKSAAEKKRANALRQHRFRERRKAEFAALRTLAVRANPAVSPRGGAAAR